MPFPADWPPRPASSHRTHRAYVRTTATANFDDNGVLWRDLTGANTFAPTPVVPPGSEAPVAYGTIDSSGSPMGGGVGQQIPGQPATTTPRPMIWCCTIQVTNESTTPGENLEISFDGINVQGFVAPGTTKTYRNRYEAGIAVRSQSGTPQYHVEAW